MPYYGNMQPQKPDINAILATKDQPVGSLLMNLGMANAASGGSLSSALTGGMKMSDSQKSQILTALAGAGAPTGAPGGAPAAGMGQPMGEGMIAPDAGGQYSSMIMRALAGG